jgi:hypothetical protein
MTRRTTARSRPRARRVLVWLVLACCAGCGGPKTYPVRGQLLWADGKPVTEFPGGTVIFESTEQPVSAQGEIQADGTFRLSTYQQDDGAPPGKYRVLVQQPLEEGKDRPPPRIMHQRFESFETSGLTATVERKANEVTLTVERAAGRGNRR